MQTFINNRQLQGLRDAVSYNTANSPTTDLSANTLPLVTPPVAIVTPQEEEKIFGIPKLWVLLGGAGLLVWLITKD